MNKKVDSTHYVYTRLNVPCVEENESLGYRFTAYRLEDLTKKGKTVYRVNVENCVDGTKGVRFFDNEDDAMEAIVVFKYESQCWELW